MGYNSKSVDYAKWSTRVREEIERKNNRTRGREEIERKKKSSLNL